MPAISAIILSILLHLIINDTNDRKRHLVNDLFDGVYDKEKYSGYLETNIEVTELFCFHYKSVFSRNRSNFIMVKNRYGFSSNEAILEEISPFILFPYQKQPVLHEYYLNKKVSVFFIEIPGAVGFSKVTNENFYYDDSI